MSDTLKRADTSFTEFGKITGPFSTRSERISKNIDEALEKSNGALTDIRGLLKVLDRADGTFRKILVDPSLYNNLDSAAILLTRLFPRLEHPEGRGGVHRQDRPPPGGDRPRRRGAAWQRPEGPADAAHPAAGRDDPHAAAQVSVAFRAAQSTAE